MRRDRKTMRKRKGKLEREIEDCLQRKRKSVFHCFFEEDILGRREFVCFVLHGCSILIDRKKWHKFVLMMYITVWVVVCVIPACCFFYECLNEKTSSYIFWQKMDCFCFFINILLVRCHLHWQDWRFSIVNIFISFLNCVTKIAWDYWETHFVIVFFSNQRIPSGGSSVPGGTIWSSSSTNAHFGLSF